MEPQFPWQREMQQLGVEYLSQNRYESNFPRRCAAEKTLYYRRNRREFEQLVHRYGSELQKELHYPPLEVRFLGNELGRGLFAGEEIKAGAFLGEYTGLVRPVSPELPLPQGGYTSDYSWGFPQYGLFSPHLEIDAREAGGPLRFANHSFSPSAQVEHLAVEGLWRVIFVAAEPIPKGWEITVNYGDAYWIGGKRELVL
ncbi:MAG: SET domain-containing protein-lysine N-methyltransferase [Spirochaetales bacterium]|nr:SET domain-containing protein-lysine N-methyltransferase [Spirochaetales bacterium]